MKICLFDGSLFDVRISERMSCQKGGHFFADLANLAHIRQNHSNYLQFGKITTYHQDLWDIYANVNNFVGIFVTHSFTNFSLKSCNNLQQFWCLVFYFLLFLEIWSIMKSGLSGFRTQISCITAMFSLTFIKSYYVKHYQSKIIWVYTPDRRLHSLPNL
jgi:hypothetical protein